MTEQLKEVVEFLHPKQPHYVHKEALSILAPYISDADLHDTLIHTSLPSRLARLLTVQDHQLHNDTLTAMINLSTSAAGRKALIHQKVPIRVMDNCRNLSSKQQIGLEQLQLSAMLLSNLTIEETGRKQLLHDYDGVVTILRLLEWFLKPPFIVSEHKEEMNSYTDGWDQFGMVLANISQEDIARDVILDEDRMIFRDLLTSFVNAKEEKKLHILRIIRNCAFDQEKHDLLLDNLHILISPLIGADLVDLEEFDEFPTQIRSMWNVEKQREESPDVRRIILELIEVLVRSQETRDIMKEWNIYLILREYDNWEEDESLNEFVYDLVQWFILDDDDSVPALANERL